jgi:hypothetical protein
VAGPDSGPDRVGAGTGQAGGCLILDFEFLISDEGGQRTEGGTRHRVCGRRLGMLSCECRIYFMKSGIDRREVRSESEILVSLEFGESSE